MTQMTFTLADEMRGRIESAATSRGLSVDAWLRAVISRALTDPASGSAGDSEDEVARVRARFAEAGLLMQAPRLRRPPPDPALVEAAKVEAGKGRSLSDLVIEDRR